MDKVKTFYTIVKRNYLSNELYAFGVIRGLEIGICDLTLKKTLDYEILPKFVLHKTETTQERFDTFRNTVEALYPGLCEFREGES